MQTTASSLDHLTGISLAALSLGTAPARELRNSCKLQMGSPKPTRCTPSLARGLVSPGGSSSPMKTEALAQSYHTADRSNGTVTQPCIAKLRLASIWASQIFCGRFRLRCSQHYKLRRNSMPRSRVRCRPVIEGRIMQRANAHAGAYLHDSSSNKALPPQTKQCIVCCHVDGKESSLSGGLME
jgi:hypothetical protein